MSQNQIVFDVPVYHSGGLVVEVCAYIEDCKIIPIEQDPIKITAVSYVKENPGEPEQIIKSSVRISKYQFQRMYQSLLPHLTDKENVHG